MTEPAASTAYRVPRSQADDLYPLGEAAAPSRSGIGTVTSVEAETATVLMGDETISGVVFLGRDPAVGDLVEVEARGDLLVIPADWDYLEQQSSDAAHLVDTNDPPGLPDPIDVNVSGSMREAEAWSWLAADAANWTAALDPGGVGLIVTRPVATSGKGDLWSSVVFDVAPGDQLHVTFTADPLVTLTGNFRVVVVYGPEGVEPTAGATDTTAAAVPFAAVTIAADATLLDQTLTVPASITTTAAGVGDPAVCRIGVRFNSTVAGNPSVLLTQVTVTRTPAAWPIGSVWYNPAAPQGGAPTAGISGAGSSTATLLPSTTTFAPAPGVFKAITKAPPDTGGIALVTAYGTVQARAGSVLELRLAGGQVARVAPSTLPGTVVAYAGATIPAGWLVCDGTVQLQADYPDLYAVIGSNFNTGGETGAQFRLPDLRRRFVYGLASALDTLGGAEGAALGARTPRHVHPIVSATGHTHDAGSLASTVTNDRLAGSAARAANPITGNTGTNGAHDHSGNTQLSTLDAVPFITLYYVIQAGPAEVPFQISAAVDVAAAAEVTTLVEYRYVTAPTYPARVVYGGISSVFLPGALRSGQSQPADVRFYDGGGWKPDALRAATIDVSVDGTVVPTPKTPTTTTIIKSRGACTVGETITLTATVTPSAADGAVTFYKGASSTGPWTSLGSVATLPGTADVTKRWTATKGSWWFRAAYQGSAVYVSSSGVTASALVATVDTQDPAGGGGGGGDNGGGGGGGGSGTGGGGGSQVVTKTKTVTALWVQPYNGSGAQISGSGHDNAVNQGYFSSTHGNRKSLIRFNPGLPADAAVTDVKLKCSGWQHWYNNAGGTLRLGAHTETSGAPASWPAGVIQSEHNVDTGAFTVTLGWAKDNVASPSFGGIRVGPGDGNGQQFYGYANDGPDIWKLVITYRTSS